MKRKTRIYAAYRGEQWLGDGTIHELAEQFNLSAKRVSWLGTPAAHKRIKSSEEATGLLFYFIDYEDYFEEEAREYLIRIKRKKIDKGEGKDSERLQVTTR